MIVQVCSTYCLSVRFLVCCHSERKQSNPQQIATKIWRFSRNDGVNERYYCHPELVSGSNPYSMVQSMFSLQAYEMLKRVQHDSFPFSQKRVLLIYRLPRKSGDFLAMTGINTNVVRSTDSECKSAGKACNINLVNARRALKQQLSFSFFWG